MTHWLSISLVLGVAVWALWTVWQPAYAFRIRVRNGETRLLSGKMTQRSLRRFAEICRDHGVTNGWIVGVRHDRQIVLRFSNHFSAGSQQQIRNDWHSQG